MSGFLQLPQINWSQDDLSFLQGASSFEWVWEPGEFNGPLPGLEPNLRDEANTQDYLLWSRSLDNMQNDWKRMTIEWLVDLVSANITIPPSLPIWWTTWQALVKNSNTDYDVEWWDLPAGFSGSYLDLSDVPSTFTPSSHTHPQSDITWLVAALASKSDTGHTHAYSSLTGIPSTFTPSAHTHPYTEVTGLTQWSVPFTGPTGILAQDNTSLFWDNTLKRLSVFATLSSEMVTNWWFTWWSTWWTLPSWWTYSSNTVIHSSNWTWALSQNVGIHSHREYVLTFTISSLTAGTVTPSIGWVNGNVISANGTYSVRVATWINATALVAFTPSNTARFTIDTISVKQLTGGKLNTGELNVDGNWSNGWPGTTKSIGINNLWAYSWLDWRFSWILRVADWANSSGWRDFYASWWNYFWFYSGNSGLTSYSLMAYIYPTAFVHSTGGWYFYGRVSAGYGGQPNSTLASAGSFASKAIRVTSNYTLTVNESVIYADASSAACSGTPTYSCSHWTNQTDCEKWDAHGGCSWFAGNSCSVYNGDQSSCESTSGCAWESNDCSYIGAYDEYSCTVYSGCSWSNNPWDCSPFDEWTCTGTTWCSASYDYCYNYSDGGWDGTACATVSWHGCNYDSGSGACSDWMGDMGWFTSCSGSYDNYSCTGTYYTGNCTGTYWASCTGTSACSGINDSTNCGFETGCSWSTAITLNLPQITTVPFRHYWVYNDSSSGADVILQPYSGDQIDKTTSYTLANYKDSVHIQAFYESVSCASFNEWACTPSGCTKQYSSCSWDWMSGTCSGNAVCDGIGDQYTCESTQYFSYCSGNYYSIKNWYLLSRS